MDIGKHCSICNRIDFLPFYCKKCSSHFCKIHYISNEHDLKCKEPLKITNNNKYEIKDRCVICHKGLFYF